MAKRAGVSKDFLTGGTKDVNPQYLTGNLTLTTVNTPATATITTPIVRVGQQNNGRAVIMELIRLYASMPLNAEATPAAETFRTSTLTLSTKNLGTAAPNFSDGSVLAQFSNAQRVSFTAAGTGKTVEQLNPMVWDFTDGQGHGVLVATDEMFLQGDTDGWTAALARFDIRILYRFKEVSLVEYIGIVQGQQQ